jgi:hypothetical protein
MVAAGWRTSIDRFPNPNNLNHLASVDFSALEFVTAAQRALAEAIQARRTDRLPFAAPAQWESTEATLRQVVDTDVATLHVVPDDSRPQLAEASRLSEEQRKYDSPYHAELEWWTTQDDTAQGVPPTALVSEEETQRLDVSRRFPPTAHGLRRRRHRPGSLQDPGAVHPRRQPRVRPGRRRDVVEGAAGVHGGGAGDLPFDPHDRGHPRTRDGPYLDPKVGDAPTTDPGRQGAADGDSATSHTETTAQRRVGDTFRV